MAQTCECGCGGTTERGDFLQGHDQRLRANLEQRVGGLLKLRALVEVAEQYAGGDLPVEAFSARIAILMAKH